MAKSESSKLDLINNIVEFFRYTKDGFFRFNDSLCATIEEEEYYVIGIAIINEEIEVELEPERESKTIHRKLEALDYENLGSIYSDLKNKRFTEENNLVDRFPNGFTNWQETHFEVVQSICKEWFKESPQGVVADRQAAQGHGGLYELAMELADKFERKHSGHQWNGEFFEAIGKFMNEELYGTQAA